MKSDKILVEVSPGEIIDKITILSIKLDMISDENKLKNINYEYSILLKTRDKFLPQSPELEKLSFNLREVNEKLWQIEDEIRDCESRKDFSKNFGVLGKHLGKHGNKPSLLGQKKSTNYRTYRIQRQLACAVA